MKTKRYTGYNGARRKIARLLEQFYTTDEHGWPGYDTYVQLEPIAEKIYDALSIMPKNDIAWDCVSKVAKVMNYHDWIGYVDEAIRDTY